MRLLIAIPHYFNPSGGTGHGSLDTNPAPRIQSFIRCLAAIRQHFGRPQCILDIARRTTTPANHAFALSVEVIVCTAGDSHLLAKLPLNADYFAHREMNAEPKLLGFECHAALQERLADRFDFYGYLEDDGTDLLFPHAATVFVSGPAITWHEGHLPLSTVPGFSHQSFDLAASTRQLAEGHHLAVFQQHSPTFTGDVRGAYIDARKPGVLFAVNQTGCGAPSEPSIGLTGTPALGRTFTIGLGNVTGFPFLLVGPENFSLLPGCGGCSAGIDLSQMQAFGSASLSVDVPPAPSLLQFRLAFQGLTMLQTGGCPASFVGFDFALSDTLTVQIL